MADQKQATPAEPGPCGVCRSTVWEPRYSGPIRDGVFGNSIDAVVFGCRGCGVGFLPSSVATDRTYYARDDYRRLVGEGSDAESFFKAHDSEQLARYPLLDRVKLRGSVVADVGAAAGSFLDGVRGFASTTIAIEPSTQYHESLRERSHRPFASVSEAGREWRQRVDVAVCFSVIEHVIEPVTFLADIRSLLAPGGQLLVSTPNSRDVLLEVGCEPYRAFFYRRVHAYYFDAASLETTATLAGFGRFEPRYVHRFNFGNFVNWLDQHRPAGDRRASALGPRFDRIWKTELEEHGLADYLYAWMSV